MWTKAFWSAAAERCVRAASAAILSLWLVGDLTLNALQVDYPEALGVGVGAALVSLLISLTAGATNPDTGPSFGTETPSGNVAAVVHHTRLQTALGKSVPVASLVAGPAAPTIPDGTPVAVTREGE